MQMEGIISKGQIVPITFQQASVAASQTNVQLKTNENGATSGELAVDEVSIPFAGSIVGLSYNLSAAGSAGTCTIGATINGTENATTTQTVGTNQRATARFGREAVRFAAGDRIGAEITTDGSWNGTTADLQVTIWVLLELEGI